jgi:hypothetical protein
VACMAMANAFSSHKADTKTARDANWWRGKKERTQKKLSSCLMKSEERVCV